MARVRSGRTAATAQLSTASSPASGALAPASLADLPDELLLRVFDNLALSQRCAGILCSAPCPHRSKAQDDFACAPACLALLCRHSTAPLVCKRFAALCHTPELLHVIGVKLAGPTLLTKMRAFCGWLAQHAAGHARVLDVWLPRLDLLGPGMSNDAAEATASLLAAAAACAAAGRLVVLRLDLERLDWPLRLGSWAAALGGLHTLSYSSSSALEVTW